MSPRKSTSAPSASDIVRRPEIEVTQFKNAHAPAGAPEISVVRKPVTLKPPPHKKHPNPLVMYYYNFITKRIEEEPPAPQQYDEYDLHVPPDSKLKARNVWVRVRRAVLTFVKANRYPVDVELRTDNSGRSVLCVTGRGRIS